MGGVATRARLVSMCSRSDVDRALATGDLVVLAHGRYAGPGVDAARAAARRLSGVVSHLSAAVLHGWEVARPPAQPVVTVPRKRKLPAARAVGVDVRWGELAVDDVRDGVTTPARTLLDCGRALPWGEALAVWDSAARAGVGGHELALVAAAARGPGSRGIRRLSLAATGLAANPFESVLRSIADDVPGLRVRPQVPLWAGAEFLGRPDLVDVDLGIVVEAESFTWHGDRAAFDHDVRRYTMLVVEDWTVLRFTWHEVMDDPAYVRRVLVAAVARREQRTRSA